MDLTASASNPPIIHATCMCQHLAIRHSRNSMGGERCGEFKCACTRFVMADNNVKCADCGHRRGGHKPGCLIMSCGCYEFQLPLDAPNRLTPAQYREMIHTLEGDHLVQTIIVVVPAGQMEFETEVVERIQDDLTDSSTPSTVLIQREEGLYFVARSKVHSGTTWLGKERLKGELQDLLTQLKGGKQI